MFRDLAGFWYESGRIRDLSVKDNDFCGGKETEVGAYIRIGVAGFDDARAPLIHKHIEIINNRFDKARPLAVSAGGAKELFVGGNTDGGKPLAPERVSVPNPAVRFRFSNSSKE